MLISLIRCASHLDLKIEIGKIILQRRETINLPRKQLKNPQRKAEEKVALKEQKIVLFKSIRNSKRRNKGNFTSKSN